jgi:hypothetical protein
MYRVAISVLLTMTALATIELLPTQPVLVNRQVVIAATGRIFAPIGSQVGWLDLDTTRRRPVSHLASPAYVVDVAAMQSGSTFAIAISAPFGARGTSGSDIVTIDASSGATTSTVQRLADQESLAAPAWWANDTELLFERDDLAAPLPTSAGQSTPRYASRVETVAADGSHRTTLIANGRMPNPAPDGSGIALVQTTDQGTGLVFWSRRDGSTITRVPFGQFADLAYPRFSPHGDRIAFMVPEQFIGQRQECGAFRLTPCIALAHGLPWDLWIVNTDGTGLGLLAAVGGDDASVT